MYIEEFLARILRLAAQSGTIRNLDAAEIYTDMNGTNEWEGRAKLYVLREDTRPIGDLADPLDGPTVAESTVTLAAIGADKDGALETIEDVVRTLRGYVKITCYGGETVLISEGETAYVDEGEILASDRISVRGEITGAGLIVAERTGGEIAPEITPNPIGSAAATAASGVERFENGAWREQYYQTRKYKVVHKLEL